MAKGRSLGSVRLIEGECKSRNIRKEKGKKKAFLDFSGGNTLFTMGLLAQEEGESR